MKFFKKFEYNAPVTLTFALISLISLLLGFITNLKSTELLFMTYRSGLLNPMTYVRLFTYCLGHANWEHYIGNMSYLLLLGPMVEEKYGSKKMLIMIIITAAIGGILNNIFFPNTALCGASGIVFMLIVLSSATSVESGHIPLTLVLILVIYLGSEIYNAIFVTDSISQFAHILGGICGAFFGLTYNQGKKQTANN